MSLPVGPTTSIVSCFSPGLALTPSEMHYLQIAPSPFLAIGGNLLSLTNTTLLGVQARHSDPSLAEFGPPGAMSTPYIIGLPFCPKIKRVSSSVG